MKKAVTLVHKGAMEIAVHAVRTFVACFKDEYQLDIHVDGSLDSEDRNRLQEACGMANVRIIGPEERRTSLIEKLATFPRTADLLIRGGFFTKLELPMVVEKPYFYFDSDIVWLRPCAGFEPVNSLNAFSTETWSWYYGLQNSKTWIADRVPRRVNSGFYHLGEEFPFSRMESMLVNNLYNPDAEYNGDQEILAFLFRDMAMYHPEDLLRTRVGVRYKLSEMGAVAVHFPGKMWKDHLDQIHNIHPSSSQEPGNVRFKPAVPLSMAEISRMKLYQKLEQSAITKYPVRWYRALRKMARSFIL